MNGAMTIGQLAAEACVFLHLVVDFGSWIDFEHFAGEFTANCNDLLGLHEPGCTNGFGNRAPFGGSERERFFSVVAGPHVVEPVSARDQARAHKQQKHKQFPHRSN
jgi:hypothetical protein